MKTSYLLLILICSLSGIPSFGSPDADSLFQKANTEYQEGNYEKAIDYYLRIDSLGLQSPEVYFNVGNAYFRSNKLGKARVYYERALLLNPSDKDIKQNLKFLETMLTDRFEEIPEFFVKTWIKSFLNLWHSNTWAVFSLISFGLFLVGGLLYIFSRKIRARKLGFYNALIFLVLSVFCFFISKRNFSNIEDPETAVIMESSQAVKSSPRNSGKDLFLLHVGTKVWMENELDNWIEVRLSDGRKGWVPVSSIEKI